MRLNGVCARRFDLTRATRFNERSREGGQVIHARLAARDDNAGTPGVDQEGLRTQRSVYFDYNSSSVKAEFNPALQAHARYLAANPKSRVRIEGNADERGPAGYNNVLGLKRADHVRQSIVEFGASEKQVVVKSLGERKPKLNGHDEESWAENRRADIIYEREE